MKKLKNNIFYLNESSDFMGLCIMCIKCNRRVWRDLDKWDRKRHQNMKSHQCDVLKRSVMIPDDLIQLFKLQALVRKVKL